MCVGPDQTVIRERLPMLQFLSRLEAANLDLGSEFLPETSEALANVRICRALSAALSPRLQCT